MPNFSEADIRAGASAQSYSRGVSYYADGAVLEMMQRDNIIAALVAGSDYDPYAVTIVLDASGGVFRTDCSCPFDLDGYCKHIVATLLAVLKDGKNITVHPGMTDLLAGLRAEDLRQLIVNVARGEPGFADAVEREVNLLRKMGASPAAQPGGGAGAVVDLAAIRRDLQRSFRLGTQRRSGGYRHDYYDEESEYIDAEAIFRPHLAAARSFLAGGNPAAAGEMLATVIDEWGECVADLDEWDYDASEDSIDLAVDNLDVLLAECLLSQPLTPAERRGWHERLDAWAEDVARLATTALALKSWWDAPWLQNALQGRIPEPEWRAIEPVDDTEADESADWADAAMDDIVDLEDKVQALTPVWLSILEREGRTEEYLNLALAAGKIVPYLLKLVAVGAAERAVAAALARPLGAAASLSVAKALAEQERRRDALIVAEHGLAAESAHGKGELACWLAALAEQAGERELMLRAARIAFLNRQTLADYQIVERAAGAAWPAVKGTLLAALTPAYGHQVMEIYLYEQMLPEAMALVDSQSFYGDLTPILDATRADYPDWSIRQCKRRAEPIMNEGKSAAYADAAAWLGRARQIYAQHGRLAEWDAYLAGLLVTHGRKYKLVPMLRALA